MFLKSEDPLNLRIILGSQKEKHLNAISNAHYFRLGYIRLNEEGSIPTSKIAKHRQGIKSETNYVL